MQSDIIYSSNNNQQLTKTLIQINKADKTHNINIISSENCEESFGYRDSLNVIHGKSTIRVAQTRRLNPSSSSAPCHVAGGNSTRIRPYPTANQEEEFLDALEAGLPPAGEKSR